MPKDLTEVRFMGGVSRIKNSDIRAPFNLENAEMQRNGFVRAVNAPTEFSPETGDTKPYILWNGDILDRSFYSQAEDGSQIDATVLSQSTLNAKLYRSVKAVDNETNDNYRTVTVSAQYDEDTSTTDGLLAEPAIAYDSSADLRDFNEFSGVVIVESPNSSTNVLEDIYTPYIAIPYNKLEEPGPWYHFFVRREVWQVDTKNFVRPADVTVNCNDETEYVRIFRASDINLWGHVHGGPVEIPELSGTGTESLALRQVTDDRFFFYDEYRTARNNATGVKEINFEDTHIWLPQIVLTAILDEWPTTVDSSASEYDYRINTDFSSSEFVSNKYEVPDVVRTAMTERRNRHAVHEDIVSTNPYQYHGVVGNVMDQQGNLIMYGDAKYPTKRPSTGLMMKHTDGVAITIKAQLEYVDSRGNVYYGPLETITGVSTIKFAWQGESALLIRFNSDEKIYERLSPNEFGVYTTGFKVLSSANQTQTLPISFTWILDRDGVVFAEDAGATVVDYIEEPNAVFLSESDRGSTVTYDSFFVKSTEVVRAITGARLAEEESIRDYDFYVFTDKSVSLYKRTGNDLRTILPVHDVTRQLGVYQGSLTIDAGTDPTITNFVAPTRFGVAFIGTDERIYHLVGRDLQQLDINVPGLFVNNFGYRDMAYHANLHQLWILFNNSSVWVYDFIQQGWTKHFLLGNVHYNLYYNDTTGFMHSWGSRSLSKYTYQFDEDDDNIVTGGTLWTQPIDEGGGESQLQLMEVDYVRDSYIDTDKTNWAYLRHSIRAPSIARVEDIYDPAGGKRLIEFKIPANRPFYPHLKGRGHQFKIANFQELRGMEFILAKSSS